MATEQRPSQRTRERSRDGRGRGRRRALVWVGRAAALALVFFAGLALGRALERGPNAGETNTSVRTLVPTTLAPRETVTVTLSSP